MQPPEDDAAFGKYLLLKHPGHSEWCGGGSGQQYCETEYALFFLPDVDDTGGHSLNCNNEPLATWSGRWTKKKQERAEQLCNPYRVKCKDL